MLELLSRMFGRESPSKEIAKERLRLVLVNDRASVSPQFLEVLKGELVKVISEYMEIDDKGTDVTINNSDSSVALVANIPIRRVKRRATAY